MSMWIKMYTIFCNLVEKLCKYGIFSTFKSVEKVIAKNEQKTDYEIFFETFAFFRNPPVRII